jgi:hypothetical protein
MRGARSETTSHVTTADGTMTTWDGIAVAPTNGIEAMAESRQCHPTYETRAVAKWFRKDERLHCAVQDMTTATGLHLGPGSSHHDRDLAVNSLTNWLEQFALDELGDPQQGRSMDEDLLLYSCDEVDWHSLAYDELEQSVRDRSDPSFRLGVEHAEIAANRYDEPAEVIHQALRGKYDGAGVRHEVQQIVRHELTRGPDETWSLGQREWNETQHLRVADRLKEYVEDNLRQHVDSSLASELVAAEIREEGQWWQIAAERLPQPAKPLPLEPPRSTPEVDEGKGASGRSGALEPKRKFEL